MQYHQYAPGPPPFSSTNCVSSALRASCRHRILCMTSRRSRGRRYSRESVESHAKRRSDRTGCTASCCLNPTSLKDLSCGCWIYELGSFCNQVVTTSYICRGCFVVLICLPEQSLSGGELPLGGREKARPMSGPSRLVERSIINSPCHRRAAWPAWASPFSVSRRPSLRW